VRRPGFEESGQVVAELLLVGVGDAVNRLRKQGRLISAAYGAGSSPPARKQPPALKPAGVT
jgi:hypothetical protein